MSKLKMKQTFCVLIILSLLALTGCNNSGTDKSKELELKEKELELKEKELELKEKGSKKGDSDKAEKAEDDSDKAEKTKKAEKTNPAIVTAKQVNGTWSLDQNKIKILALGGGKLKVQFDLKSGSGVQETVVSASGTGNIEGIDATFVPDSDFDTKCKFTMKFTGGKMIVKQVGDESDCEFGARVSADGTYEKTS